jgi:hypothetical protein
MLEIMVESLAFPSMTFQIFNMANMYLLLFFKIKKYIIKLDTRVLIPWMSILHKQMPKAWVGYTQYCDYKQNWK